MKNRLAFLLVFLFSIHSFAQPLPCVDPEMTPRCIDACVICDIDGFAGRNFDRNGGEAPFDFCTTFVHNISWIAFVAGTPNLVLDVKVSNCVIGWGLEIGIYESLDCDRSNMRQMSNCNTNAAPGTHRFTVTEPLVVGQYYYFVMDGSGDDVCTYEVSVVEGSTLIGALENIDLIDGPTTSCPGDTLQFTVPERAGATFQEWRINGDLVLEDEVVLEYTFDQAGAYEVCYSAYNVCDTIPEICKDVVIRPLPTIFKRDTVCDSDCFYLAELDTLICTPGQTNLEEITPEGCVQSYLVDLIIRPTPSSDLVLEFCSGDSVIIGDQSFSTTGNYQPTLISKDGCDSLVNLSITTFLCDIDGGFVDDRLECPGDTDGTLRFNLLDGTFPYQYSWEEKTGTGLTGSGTSTTPGVAVVVSDLPAGIYSVTVTDADGSRGVFVGQIFEPNPILADFITSDYNGFGATCPESTNGSIELVIEGGTPDYTYKWENSTENSQKRIDLAPGSYSVSVTDASGCEVVITPEIIAPLPLSANLQITEPECAPDNSGIISASDIKGGVGPFQVAFNNGDFENNFSFRNLFAGDYQLTIRDLNGCEVSLDTMLAEPNSISVELGNELEIFLGDSIELNPQVNLNNLTYDWSGVAISCADCPMTFVRPFESSQYNLVVTMPNRCTKSDSVFVKVIDRRRVFVPSAFSPNNDGINDFLPIFGGTEVTQVIDFQVFGRWGELIYKAENFQPNDSEFGWDGKFKGDELDSGVYVWIANVEFIDGKTSIYEGDVSLLK